MRSFLTRILFTLLLVVISSDWWLANAENKQGVSVSPAIIRLDLSTDEPEAELIYQNNTSGRIELSFSAQDFSELEEGGRVKFFLEQDAGNYQYGLSSWITFEKQSIVLAPGETQTLKVFVSKEKLTPGGHYATIQAEMAGSNEGEGTVPVKAILSSLLFARASTGNEREEMGVQSFEPIQIGLGFPETFLLRLQNTGNVEVVPYGLVEVKDIFGRVAAKGVINEGSLITLPESVRRFDVPLVRQERFLFPGPYKASVSVHFGDQDRTTAAQETSFVSIGNTGWLLLIPVVLAGVIIWKKKS